VISIKVLMLNPPFLPKFSRTSRSPAVTKGGCIYYPIWLSYATGVLEKSGFEVKLIDAPARGYSEEKTLKIAERFNPDLVVVDTSTPSIFNDVAIAERIKKLTNGFVVLVGTHVSALPEETLKLSPSIDAVARMEYDYTIRELAFTLEKNGDLRKVKGITFRKNKRIISNPPRPFIDNLNELPFVSEVYKKHLRIEDYFYPTVYYPEVTIVSGRGCPYRCTFCLYTQVFWGRRYRLRSPKNIVDELEFIKNEITKAQEIMFEDDSLASKATSKRCREICREIIRRKLDISFVANSRADVDLETLRLLKKAGCRLLCVGFESGNQNVLNQMKKGITLRMMKDFIKNAKKVGIAIHGCYVFGTPGDNLETIKETIKFAISVDSESAQFYPIMVYPGTEAYNWAKATGYLITEDYSKWLTPEGWHNCMVSRPGLSAKQLVRLCDHARMKFYFRPRYFLKRAKLLVKNFNEVKRTLVAAKTFFPYVLKILSGLHG
jgi:radical SAM superfamily enzyme YgiQ (UPF0313 family)